MTKMIDIDELTESMDASLVECREAYETSYLARAMIDLVRPAHIWRAQERNRGTSGTGILEGLLSATIQLVASELEDIDASDEHKFAMVNYFLQCLAEGIAEKMGQIPTGQVHEREVGHA